MGDIMPTIRHMLRKSRAMLPWALRARLAGAEYRITRLERMMAKDRDALAALDGQIADLRAYVESDEESDAQEIEKRTNEIKQVLADARSTAAAPAEDLDTRETELDDVVTPVEGDGATPPA